MEKDKFITSLPKDKYGYYLLDKSGFKIKSKYKNNRRYFLVEENGNYYFKLDSFEPRPYYTYDLRLSEVVIGKFYKELGFNAVQYYFARKGTNNYGVVSKDFENENCMIMREYLDSFDPRMSLKDIKSSKKFADDKVSESFKNKLDKLSLAQIIAGGQIDLHIGNIGVCFKDEMPDDIVVFDNSVSCILNDDPKNLYKNLSKIDVVMGVEQSRTKLDKFLQEVKTSPYISTSAISEFLTVANNALTNDKCFKKIEEEFVEEYDNEVPKLFMGKLKFIANTACDFLNDAYNDRIHILGE